MREPKIELRWLIRQDMDRVLEIEQESFGHPWSRDDFYTCLRHRNCIGMVYQRDEHIVGFMVYELQKLKLQLHNFAVAADSRRQGVGRALIDRLKSKLHQQRRNAIHLAVSEDSLGAQLFFREMGFRSCGVLRGYYDDAGRDAYAMEYLKQSREQEQQQNEPPQPWRNRINGLTASE